MELTPDTKYLVAQKLSGKDLVKLCSTDKEMRKLCSSDKYNKLWQEKLKEDYDVKYEGKNAYMEYLQNTYFYNKGYYIVTVVAYGYTESELFKKRKDAINWIASEINQQTEEIPFVVIRSSLDSDGEIILKDYGTTYYLTRSSFNNKKLKDFESEYDEKLKEITKIIGDEDLDPEEFKLILSEKVVGLGEVVGLEDFLIELKEEYQIDEENEKLIRQLLISN
jgi:hypothetical protein